MSSHPSSAKSGAPNADAPTNRAGRALNIKEFADAIGVSPTTVSRSITQRGRVSEETRAMVLQRMDELGYSPNLHAQRLISGRSNTVALCLSGGSAPATDLFLAGLIRGLQGALQFYDNGLLILGPGDMLRRWVDSRAVDGVILIGGSSHADESARQIARPGVPCILIGSSALPAENNVGQVVIDLAGGSAAVARALFERGHRRIGFIGSSYSQSVLPAFGRELEQLGAPLSPELTLIAGDNSADGARAMNEMLALPDPPTAVFARTDELAVGALRAARRSGVAVPAQLSLVGHDDLAYARFSEPPLSTVRIDCDAVGKAVVATLFEMIERADAADVASVPRVVPTELVLRQSVAELADS